MREKNALNRSQRWTSWSVFKLLASYWKIWTFQPLFCYGWTVNNWFLILTYLSSLADIVKKRNSHFLQNMSNKWCMDLVVWGYSLCGVVWCGVVWCRTWIVKTFCSHLVAGEHTESSARSNHWLAQRGGGGGGNHSDRTASELGADSTDHDHFQPATVQHWQCSGAEWPHH